MSDLTPERRDEMRRAVTECTIPMGSTMWPAEMLALLDAADERDRLLTVVHEADQLHAAALAAEGELLGDSPEMPRWERLLLNGLTLPELAKNVADERDKLAAAAERVRALHKPGDLMAWSEDCDDPEGHQWIDDPHGGGMLCADEISGAYCVGCAPDDATDMSDYPHPCPTLRALDGTDE